MENNLLTSVHQRKATKKTTKSKKNNNHPIKVVYISNPMKVKTSASQFRALVQELTGQDSELPPDPTKFSDKDDHDVARGLNPTAPDHHPIMMNDGNKMVGDDDDDDDLLPTVDPAQEQPESSSSQIEPYDDVFTPQMIENFSGLLPTSVFYDSPQLDVRRRLDAV
uniref:VQ domain-containing protein n=1 Tax=Fagus sylvatica TaxID=28930 RepID=A0A2N9HD59_FAGSY